MPGHDASLYLIPPAGTDSEGFYSDPRSGEFWIGRRPGLAEFEAMTGIATAPLKDLPGGIRLSNQPTKAVHRALAEMRFVKDEYEIQQMRDAVDATIEGFARAVTELPRAIEHKRGERVVEAAFDGHAREEGNAVGYETIAASGDHATTLHWIRNDGQVRRATSCCSTPAWRSRASTRPTSRAPFPSTAPSPPFSAGLRGGARGGRRGIRGRATRSQVP